MKRLLLILLAVSAFAQTTMPTLWRWPTDWRMGTPYTVGPCGVYAHCASFTVASQSTTLTNFPVLVIATASTVGSVFETVANGGQINNTVTQSGGNPITEPADLVWGTTQSCQTLVPWETLYYSANGTASSGARGGYAIWRVYQTLSSSASTVFYACWGKSSISTQQNTGSYAPSHVWASYTTVAHFNDNAATKVVVDSTGTNSLSMQGPGYTTAMQSVAGLYGTALYNDADANEAAQIIMASPAETVSGTYTVEALVNPQTISNSIGSVFNSPSNKFDFQLDTTHQVAWDIGNGSAWLSNSSFTYSYAANTWYYIAFVVNATGCTAYVNGTSETCATWASSTPLLWNSSGAVYLSAGGNSGYGFYMQEARVSPSALSATWIAAEQANIQVGSTFVTYSNIQ